MKVQIHTDVNFNPHGLHENSGVRQWFDETLLAVQQLNTTSEKYRVVELPARSTILQEVKANGRKIRFDTEYQAECWIGRNYPAIVTVQPEDITEEIARRKAAEREDEAERLADDGSSGTAKWT